jgi:ATP-binding protein involved in chromosome partitioning
MIQSQESGPPSNPLASIQAVVAIAAGKGGVGKSSVTVNLALALQAQGYQVGIMDTDIYGPSIRKMLPEDRMPTQKGALIQPALCKGIKMISMAYFRQENEATAVRAPIANGLISQFIKNVQWGDLDFLLVDFPPGTGDVQLTLSQQAHLIGAVMVTTPQEVALLDVRKAMSLFDQVKVPIIGIVENMSYYQPNEQIEPVYLFGKGGGERLASESGTPLLGKIPLDPYLCSCADKGESLFAQDPHAQRPVTRAFEQLARQLSDHIKALKAEKKEGLGSFELVWKEMGP